MTLETYNDSVNLADRVLYHQVHPLKLAIDIVSAMIGLVLLTRHRLSAGVLTLLVPPALISTHLVMVGRLEYLPATRLGRYVRHHMTATAQMLRLIGMLAMSVGAWWHNWLLVLLGATAIARVWARGPRI